MAASSKSALRGGWCCCCALFFFLSFFYFPSGAQGRSVPAVYVLGDSLLDVGNNNYLPRGRYKANFPHNGIDYPGGMATGRFSNGKNPADLLAEKLGLQTSPPYLSLPNGGSIGTDAFLKGVSFASAGAGVLNTTNEGRCLTLDKQIKLFSKLRRTLDHQLGRNETQKHLSRSLFVVSIGNNDLLGFFRSDVSPQRAKSSPQQLVDSLVSTLRDQLRRVYKLGARKIVFIGPVAVGCCPAQRIGNKNEECNVKANHGAIKFNKGASALLRAMRSELGDVSYSFVDAYASFQEYIQKPSIYGFVEVKAACCGMGNLNAEGACLPTAKYCSNRGGHVFWDFYHPTEAVYRLLTDTIFDGSLPYVYPLNVRKLVSL